MRKIRVAACLLLCGVLAVLCTSCFTESVFEPKSADALWEKINQTMDALNSYKAEGTMEAVLYEQGYRFDLTGETQAVNAGSKQNPYSYMHTISTLQCDQYSLREQQERIQAYYDGKVYLLDRKDNSSRKIYSEISFEEYEETFLNDNLAYTDVDLIDCTQKEYSKEEDGTWTLRLSGYTKKSLDAFLESTGVADLSASEHALDMELSIIADALFQVQTMDFEILFSSNAGQGTKLKLTYSFAEYNEAKANPDDIKTTQYTKVEDIDILKEITDQLTEIQKKESGKATLTIDQVLKNNKREQTIQEIDQISYGRKNGSLYYKVDTKYDGTDIKISYENEKRTVTANGEKETTTETERTAEVFLQGLLNNAYYNEAAVSKIEKIKAGEYKLTFAYCAVPGAESAYADQVVTVTFQNEKLVKMDSNVVVSGYVGDAWSTLTIHSVVEYKDAGSESA
ncbi:MAG: hypothetical protein IKV74_01405 [Clostridia bacterium]|nr:hypothetical protein [Clostridia bacterium]